MYKKKLWHWLGLLGCELVERLREDRHQVRVRDVETGCDNILVVQNRRYARQLAVHFQLSSSDRGVSRCCPMPDYDTARVVESAWNAMERYCSTQHWLALSYCAQQSISFYYMAGHH